MTKADLVDEISTQTKISKSETATIVDQLLNAISRALSEGKHIEIRGFGTFKVRERKARKARNPRSGAEVMVPAKLVPVLRLQTSSRERSVAAKRTRAEENDGKRKKAQAQEDRHAQTEETSPSRSTQETAPLIG